MCSLWDDSGLGVRRHVSESVLLEGEFSVSSHLCLRPQFLSEGGKLSKLAQGLGLLKTKGERRKRVLVVYVRAADPFFLHYFRRFFCHQRSAKSLTGSLINLIAKLSRSCANGTRQSGGERSLVVASLSSRVPSFPWSQIHQRFPAYLTALL